MKSVKRKKAFTIVELLVAVAILVVVMGVASKIFSVCIEAQRKAAATSEIMRNFRAITDQLNADFKGLQKDAPLMIWFENITSPQVPNEVRHDQIMFFANGDFQSTKEYPRNSGPDAPVSGNLARIYYGQADIIDYSDTVMTGYWLVENQNGDHVGAKTLGRRQHIQTADSTLTVPFPNPTSFPGSFIPRDNNWFEYDYSSLSQWKVWCQTPANNTIIINTCFGDFSQSAYRPWNTSLYSYSTSYTNNADIRGRPGINLKAPETMHMLMSQGVGSFKIQFPYWAGSGGFNEWRWFPDADPYGVNGVTDSDILWNGSIILSTSGFYFNMPSVTNTMWHNITAAKYDDGSGSRVPFTWADFPNNGLPAALKFTMTLYDSRGIFPKGLTFTHIVYLAN